MKTLQFLLAALVAGAAMNANAQANARPIGLTATGQPATYDLHFEAYRVQGYGPAQFGMPADVVRAVVAKSYPGASPLSETTDPVGRTQVLTTVVPQLAPGPGPATISYVFGATTKKLVAVNVHWIAAGDATPAQRQAMLEAGTQVVAGLVGSYWAPMSTARGHVLAPGVVILFASRDAEGHGIEVRLDGVALDVQRASTNGSARPLERIAPPPGSARLRVAVVANPQRPDVYRVTPGSF